MSPPPGRPVVLTLRALGLGDLLTAVPALRALRRHHPQAHHVLACPAPLEPLARATGAVDEAAATTGLDDRAARLPSGALAVDLHGRGPQSHRLLLAHRPRALVAFHHPEVEATTDQPVWRDGEHEVDRWCRLLREHGMAADPGDLHVGVDPGPWDALAGCTILHPGAASAARRWPAPDWVVVARALRDRGHRIVLTGSRGERHRCRRIARAAGLPASSALAARTEPLDLLRLSTVARLVVTGDTGMAHVATATATPSVVLFGPTSPATWGPPTGTGRHIALWAGRTGDPHGNRPDPGLLELRPADVLAAATSLALLDEGRQPVTRPVGPGRP